MNLEIVYGLFGGALGVASPFIWKFVASFFVGDVEKGVRVVLAALDEAQAQFPAAFNDPSVIWIDYVERMTRDAIAKKELSVDPNVVFAAVLGQLKLGVK